MSKNQHVWVIELRGDAAWRPAHMCATRIEARKKAARLKELTPLVPRVVKYMKGAK